MILEVKMMMNINPKMNLMLSKYNKNLKYNQKSKAKNQSKINKKQKKRFRRYNKSNKITMIKMKISQIIDERKEICLTMMMTMRKNMSRKNKLHQNLHLRNNSYMMMMMKKKKTSMSQSHLLMK